MEKFYYEEVEQIARTAKMNGYRLADFKMLISLACRSGDEKAAFDYILEEVTKKTDIGEIIMKLIRELPGGVIEYWDEDVAGKRKDWGIKTDENK